MTYLGGGKWMPALDLGKDLVLECVRQKLYRGVNVGREHPPWISVRHVPRPKSESPIRDVKVTFRLSQAGAQWLDDNRGTMSRSAFVRWLLREAALGRVKLPDVRS